jgi:transglutaminase-like putative cysteine protease
MKISIQQSTIYRYDEAVNLEPHTFRLQPRMTSAQRSPAFDMHILPSPAGSTEALDQDGNLVLHTWFDVPVRQLSRSHSSRYRWAAPSIARTPVAI